MRRFNRVRSIRSKTSISMDAVLAALPAVAANEAGCTTCAGYQFIDTKLILQAMLDQGFVITEASQQSHHYPHDMAAAKHMIRLRQPAHPDYLPKVGDAVAELCFINSHNASTAAHFRAGLYRYVCANGLLAGESLQSIKVRHNSNAKDVVQDALNAMTGLILPSMVTQVNKMQDQVLTDQEVSRFAQAAAELRWPDALPPRVTADQVLQLRREEDNGNTVWQVFNRLQENLLEGGPYHRALENMSRRLEINQGMWDLAVRTASNAEIH